MRSHGAMILAACSTIIFAGCAGEAKRPDAEIARASTLIEQAEKSGAQRYAAAELQQARDKLQQVDVAVKEGKGDFGFNAAGTFYVFINHSILQENPINNNLPGKFTINGKI